MFYIISAVNRYCVPAVATSSLWQLQHGDARQPPAIQETAAPSTSSDLPKATLDKQLPDEAPSKQCQTHLADASKQPDIQPAMFRSGDQAQELSFAASQQQEEPPPPAVQQRFTAVESSSKGAEPSCGSGGVLVPEHDSAVQSCVLLGPARPASSEQRSAQLLASQSSTEPVAAKSAVPANHKHEHGEPCTAAEATPEKAQVGTVQTRHARTRKGAQQAESDAPAATTAVVPGVMKLRTGLRSRPDSAASVDKCRVASQVRAEFAHSKQASADSARNAPDIMFGSSRGVGRGRAYGRGGRRGRSRSNLFRTCHSQPQPAGTTLPSALHHPPFLPCSSVIPHISRLRVHRCAAH